jgi:hypothetical protein
LEDVEKAGNKDQRDEGKKLFHDDIELWEEDSPPVLREVHHTSCERKELW